MNIRDLAEEYVRSAALLRGRIRELEQQRREKEDEAGQLSLDGRLRPLRAMYRETREVARHLEGYCARKRKEE